MRRKRVTGRFYIFLLIILGVAAFLIIRPMLPERIRTATVSLTDATLSRKMDCVIIRDEEPFSSSTTARVEFVAAENSLVESGEIICNLYATGYSESLLTSLETTRSSIQEYHKELLANIVDNSLSRLDGVVNETAEAYKDLITRAQIGSLTSITDQLATAMVNRQEYLRKNKREDTKLTRLYDEENSRLNNIASWRTVSKASRGGVVSFYVDGYESDLTTENIEALAISDVKTVLSGGKLSETARLQSDGIYRIVDQNLWYAAVIIDDETWTPITGQTYQMQMEGYDDLAFDAAVVSVQKSGSTVMATFSVDAPIGPLIYLRKGKARFNTTLTGLSVSADAIVEHEGQIGVLLYDVPGGTFIPVEIISREGNTALINPVYAGTLDAGSVVLLK